MIFYQIVSSHSLSKYIEISLENLYADNRKVRKDMKTNGPFPSCLTPLFQSGARCKAIEMEIIFYSQANIAHFHKKGFALISL